MNVGVVVRESITIGCWPADVLAFVMDIERYAEVDGKIRPVLWARRDGDVVEFACRPRLAGLRQPKVVQQLRRVSADRIEIALSPPPRNRLARAMATFAASVDVRDVDGGTLVTRTLEFRFAPAVRPVFEPLFRRRLRAEVIDELQRAKIYLERQAVDG